MEEILLFCSVFLVFFLFNLCIGALFALAHTYWVDMSPLQCIGAHSLIFGALIAIHVRFDEFATQYIESYGPRESVLALAVVLAGYLLAKKWYKKSA